MQATRTLLIVTTLVLSACAGSDSSSAPGSTAPASVATAGPSAAPSTAIAPTTTQAATITEPAVLETTVTTDDGANPLGGDDPEDGLMPPVVCMNLQDAQDEIQDHGVLLSGSEDATGQGRSQVIDSNWQVVAQDPDAGVAIGELDATLFVVKYGEEPNPC